MYDVSGFSRCVWAEENFKHRGKSGTARGALGFNELTELCRTQAQSQKQSERQMTGQTTGQLRSEVR